jgi:hypothetical protein
MSGRGKGKSSKKAVSRSAKAGLQFPVGRIARYVLFLSVVIYFYDSEVVARVLSDTKRDVTDDDGGKLVR